MGTSERAAQPPEGLALAGDPHPAGFTCSDGSAPQVGALGFHHSYSDSVSAPARGAEDVLGCSKRCDSVAGGRNRFCPRGPFQGPDVHGVLQG